jgi:hypothetical protein
MGSIHSGIAGSVNQTHLQQSQVARARDAERNQRSRDSDALRRRDEEHREQVEDTEQTEDQVIRVRDEDHHDQRPQHEDNEPEGEGEQAESTDAENQSDLPAAGVDDETEPPGKHIDITA